MLHRTVALFAFGVTALVFAVSESSAQPGSKGPGSPKQLEAEIARIREQIKDLDAKLIQLQSVAKKGEKGGPPFAKGPGGFPMPGGPGGPGGGFPMPGGPGGFGKGPGGITPPTNLDPEKLKKVLALYELLYGEPKKGSRGGERGFGKKGGDFKKDFGKGGPPFGKGFGKKGMDKKKEAAPPAPPMPPTRSTPPLSKGISSPGRPPAAAQSQDARIDRLINELEQLRRELKNKK